MKKVIDGICNYFLDQSIKPLVLSRGRQVTIVTIRLDIKIQSSVYLSPSSKIPPPVWMGCVTYFFGVIWFQAVGERDRCRLVGQMHFNRGCECTPVLRWMSMTTASGSAPVSDVRQENMAEREILALFFLNLLGLTWTLRRSYQGHFSRLYYIVYCTFVTQTMTQELFSFLFRKPTIVVREDANEIITLSEILWIEMTNNIVACNIHSSH